MKTIKTTGVVEEQDETSIPRRYIFAIHHSGGISFVVADDVAVASIFAFDKWQGIHGIILVGPVEADIACIDDGNDGEAIH